MTTRKLRKRLIKKSKHQFKHKNKRTNKKINHKGKKIDVFFNMKGCNKKQKRKSIKDKKLIKKGKVKTNRKKNVMKGGNILIPEYISSAMETVPIGLNNAYNNMYGIAPLDNSAFGFKDHYLH